MQDRPDSFMPLYIGDYLADTAHLTTEEHGAYMLLLMHYWRAGGPITSDDAQLARVTRCTVKEWGKIKPTVLAFFNLEGERLVHGRVEHELKRAAEQYQAKVERAKAGAAKRWGKQSSGKPEAPAQDMPEQCLSIPQAVLDQCQPQPQPHSIGKPIEGARSRTVWPSEAVVPEKWILIAEQQRRMAGLPEIDLHVLARMFANHYAADTQNPRTMTEFQAKWNNWALKEKPANGSRTGAKSQLEQLAEIVRSNHVLSG